MKSLAHIMTYDDLSKSTYRNKSISALKSPSGWRDSNSRPPAPKAGTLTGLCYTPKTDAKVQLFSDNLKNYPVFLLNRMIHARIV